MNWKPALLTTCTVLVGLSSALSAKPLEPERPILEAAIQASPSQRLQASKFYRSAYPNLPKTVYKALKADFPNLEEGLVDAALDTWEQHPGELLELAQSVKEKFGPRTRALRAALAEELEASYPDFRERMAGVLQEHGVQARWRGFVEQSYPGLLDSHRESVRESFPQTAGWYPGKFREMFRKSVSGNSPVLDKLRGVVVENPDLGPRIARKIVNLTRAQAPGLGAEVAQHFLDNHGELREAVEAEFPGIREKIAEVVEKQDSQLPSEIWAFVRASTRDIRADFRDNLETELSGLEGRVQSIVHSNYPQLQDQILAILTK